MLVDVAAVACGSSVLAGARARFIPKASGMRAVVNLSSSKRPLPRSVRLQRPCLVSYQPSLWRADPSAPPPSKPAPRNTVSVCRTWHPPRQPQPRSRRRRHCCEVPATAPGPSTGCWAMCTRFLSTNARRTRHCWGPAVCAATVCCSLSNSFWSHLVFAVPHSPRHGRHLPPVVGVPARRT